MNFKLAIKSYIYKYIQIYKASEVLFRLVLIVEMIKYGGFSREGKSSSNRMVCNRASNSLKLFYRLIAINENIEKSLFIFNSY